MTAAGEPRSDPSPETALLFLTARVMASSDCIEQIRDTLRRELDWDNLVRLARAHGTTPLLYWNLNQHAADLVPSARLDALRGWFLDNAASNLRRTGELLRLTERFSAHAQRVLSFKGPTLAARVYGNLALRQYLDLDLLVAPADLAQTVELLLEAGYRSALPLGPAQRQAYLASMGQIALLGIDGQCMVELHARLAMRDFYFPLDLEQLWPRRQPLSINGKEVPGLADEDLLLVLCAHGSRHQWMRLAWVSDVAELVRACPNLDWPVVRARARTLHVEYLLGLGLLLARDLLQAAVPEEQLHWARSRPVLRKLTAQVHRQLARPIFRSPEGLQAALYQLRARERWNDGLRYALSLIVAPTFADWSGFRVPRALSFLYYLFRPLRLVAKYAQRAVRRKRSGRSRSELSD